MHPANGREGDAAFRTTCWSLVLRAGDQASPDRMAALEHLCGLYWYPLYAYARGQGQSFEDARDLTQEFFARLLEKNYLGVADQRKGRFRWFLLTAFKCFLANEYHRSQAAKRGGGCQTFSLDSEVAEQKLQIEAICGADPEKIFDHRWACVLLDHARDRLRSDYEAHGKRRRFEVLELCLSGDAESAGRRYAELGRELGMSEVAVKVEVHRMKRRFGELLRAEIAQTVGSDAEVKEEVRYLIRVMSG
jgi:RNA polymerase sigma-70 factor (ECF subfamily)